MGGARPRLRIGAMERIANDWAPLPPPEIKARGEFSKMGESMGCFRTAQRLPKKYLFQSVPRSTSRDRHL
jgi:hypothetical protein